MGFPENLGTITCRCVVEKGAPVLAVSHAGGDWQMYCGFANHNFESPAAMAEELVLAHIVHLVRLDPTLETIADLAPDMGAERSSVSAAWARFRDADE